jgi:hypothetical protein
VVALSTSGGREREFITLFCAVTERELDDILATGFFRNPFGVEVKYFSTTREGAASYASRAFRAWPKEGPYTIVETAIQTHLIAPSMSVVVDSNISTVTVPTSLLPELTSPRVLTSVPIPR